MNWFKSKEVHKPNPAYVWKICLYSGELLKCIATEGSWDRKALLCMRDADGQAVLMVSGKDVLTLERMEEVK